MAGLRAEAARRLPRSVLVGLLGCAGAIAGLLATGPARVAASGVAGQEARLTTAWTTYAFDNQRTGNNPFERTLTPASARRLRQIWTARTAWATVDTQPLYVPDVPTATGLRSLTVVADEHGGVYAFDARNGAPVWRRRVGAVQTSCQELPGGWFGVNGAPVIDRGAGRVYLVSGDGYLHALSLTDGRPVPGFRPLRLTSDPVHEHFYGALNLTGGQIYAVVSGACDVPSYRGRIIAVDGARDRVSSVWYVTHSPGVTGGGIWGWGGVSTDPAGFVYAATGNSFAPSGAENLDYAEHVVRLTSSLRPLAANTPTHLALAEDVDADFGATPALLHAPGCPPQAAVLEKFGSLFLYDRGSIAAGPTQRLQIGDPRQDLLIGVPAWWPAARMLLVASQSAGPAGAGLFAFHLGAGCRLRPAWHQAQPAGPTVDSTVTVAGGVAYYTSLLGQLIAVDAATGRQLYASGRLIGIGAFAAPTVVDGRVLVSGWDGAVHAFAVR